MSTWFNHVPESYCEPSYEIRFDLTKWYNDTPVSMHEIWESARSLGVELEPSTIKMEQWLLSFY
jgi:hypothetical protein